MKSRCSMVLAIILCILLLPSCASMKDQQMKKSADLPPEVESTGNGIGKLIQEYEGVVVAQNPHATLVRVDLDLDEDGVVGKADKCPGTPKGAIVDEQGCWRIPLVLFGLNSAELTNQGKAILDTVVPVLAANPSLTLSVEGHTCNMGDPAYNKELSLKRAQTVRNYLVSKGAKGARMAVTGYGSNQPETDHTTRAHRIQNRRVKIVPITE